MAWNEPGNGQDPWGGGRKDSNGGPPDLDQLWRRLRARLSKGGGGGNGGSGGGAGPNPVLLLWVIPVIIVIWLLTGFYMVQPGEQGVLLRFGKYTQTISSGWHWYWPAPIGRVISVDSQQVRSATTRRTVLTKDESLAEIEISLQYRVSEPMNYLFALTDPDLTVEQVLKSAVREMVGTSRLNQVIQEGMRPEALSKETQENVDLKQSSDEAPKTNPLQSLSEDVLEKVKKQKASYPEIEGLSRALLPENIKNIVQVTLDQYKAGIHIIAVNVEYAQPPEEVQSAFEEAIKAREAKERKKNHARAYARQVVAKAKGEKASILAGAKGYKADKIARAKGGVARFTQLLGPYEQSPDITRRRLFLETMDQVLGTARLILVDEGESGPMMYLPLQELKNKSGSSSKQQDEEGDSLPSLEEDDTGTLPAQQQQDSRQQNTRGRGRNS